MNNNDDNLSSAASAASAGEGVDDGTVAQQQQPASFLSTNNNNNNLPSGASAAGATGGGVGGAAVAQQQQPASFLSMNNNNNLPGGSAAAATGGGIGGTAVARQQPTSFLSTNNDMAVTTGGPDGGTTTVSTPTTTTTTTASTTVGDTMDMSALKDSMDAALKSIISEDDGANGQASTDVDKQEQLRAMYLAGFRAAEAALREKEAALRTEIEFYSYHGMVQRFGGIPDMPRVKDLKPHVHAGYAEFSVDDNFVTADDLNFEFCPMDKANGFTLRSFLNSVQLQKNEQDETGPEILTYQNEATVADYVQYVVAMCLQSLGYFKEGLLCKEMSLFSLRPDLILISHKTKGIILIIEVKMPGEELFTSGGIAKQVADYLLLQYRLGNTTPFVLLTSYREACLCHLKPGSLQTADTSEGGGGDDFDEYQAIVKQAAEQLRQGVDVGKKLGNGEADQKGKPTDHSPGQRSFRRPLPSVIETSEPPSKRRRRIGPRLKPKVALLSPEVVYSRPFNLGNMVNGVSLAIACGIASLEKASTKSTEHRFWPEPESSIDGLHPQVERGKLQWAEVSDMAIGYMGAPHTSLGDSRGFTDNKYILLQELGRGNSGKVFLAVDYEGIACALKFYLDVGADANAEKGFSHTQRKENRSNLLEIAKAAALEEYKRWKKLQPDFIDYVACHELNNQAVLKTPLFVPVPPEQRDENVLDMVKQMLVNLFRKGYLYKEVRWQHVARRFKTGTENELALLDMGSLLDLESLKKLNPAELAKHDLGPFLDPKSLNSNDESVIQKQVDELRRRKDPEPPEVPTGLLPPV